MLQLLQPTMGNVVSITASGTVTAEATASGFGWMGITN
jgi:hypothetical protein